MNKREYEKLQNDLSEMQEERNKLISKQNKSIRNSAYVLLFILLINAFYMCSNPVNINFFNLSLFIVPNIIELINVGMPKSKMKKMKTIITYTLIGLFILLLITLFSSFIIDNGECFKIADRALFLRGLEINKAYLVAPIFLNILIPILIILTSYNEVDKIIGDEVSSSSM